MLLAHAPTDVQEAVLAAPLRAWTPWTITEPARLRSVLADVRRTGVAISDRQVTDDAVSVAAPVVGRGGEVVAALSLVVRPRQRRAASARAGGPRGGRRNLPGAGAPRPGPAPER